MYAGIDFGTSNCSLGYWEKSAPKLLEIEAGHTLLPSALYAVRPGVKREDIDQEELEDRVRRRVNEQKQEQIDERRKMTEEQIREFERISLAREDARRQARQYRQQDLRKSVFSDAPKYFGAEAIRQQLHDPFLGHLVKSPKSLLGCEVSLDQEQLLIEIVKLMLAFMKRTAQDGLEAELEEAVVGIPVQFLGLQGEKGNEQAKKLLKKAAEATGIKKVEFIYEPVAAILDYERTLDREQKVLVLDAGGGTTDCSMVVAGPSHRDNVDRDKCILGVEGIRLGGMDMDKQLCKRSVIPLLGHNSRLQNGLPVPGSVFFKAISIDDVNAQSWFSSPEAEREIQTLVEKATDKDKLHRLLTLQQERYSYRLLQEVERAKIGLSETTETRIDLSFLEKGLQANILREDLRQAVTSELDQIGALMKRVRDQAGTDPDVIYVAGGSANSPLIREVIQRDFSKNQVVSGSFSSCVTLGLTTHANRLFGDAAQRNASRSVSLGLGLRTDTAQTANQCHSFTKACLPESMRLARNHRTSIKKLIPDLPCSWSFEDKVLVWLVPRLRAACIRFHEEGGEPLGEHLQPHQLDHLDGDLLARLDEMLREGADSELSKTENSTAEQRGKEVADYLRRVELASRGQIELIEELGRFLGSVREALEEGSDEKATMKRIAYETSRTELRVLHAIGSCDSNIKKRSDG